MCISPSYKQIESRGWHGKGNIRGMFSAKQNPEDLSLYYASLIQRKRYKEIIGMFSSFVFNKCELRRRM